MRRFICLLLLIFLVCWGVVSCSVFKRRAIGKTENLLFYKSKSGTVFAFVNSKDDSIVVNSAQFDVKSREPDGAEKEVIWYKNQKETRKIKGAYFGTVSPDGKYYSFVREGEMSIFNDKDVAIGKIKMDIESIDKIFWSLDSDYLYFSMFEDKTNIYRFNVHNKNKEQIFSKRDYMRPTLTTKGNEMYLMQNKKSDPYDHYLVKYNLLTKKIEMVQLPLIKNLYLQNDVTVSPNGELAIISSKGIIYLINLEKRVVIDQIQIPKIKSEPTLLVGDFSWKKDGSYVVFSFGSSESYGVCKYYAPSNI